MKHGTRSTYVHHKCRCDECRAAQNAYQREYVKTEESRVYRTKLSRAVRKRNQAAARWVKQNQPDLWKQICEEIRG
jgi:hypothetical protein